MFGMGMGELAVLAVVTLFVLGPDRLPGAIRWVAAAANHMKGYVAAAKEQMNAPEFDELRKPLHDLRKPLDELRAADPRRLVRDALRADGSASTAPEQTKTAQSQSQTRDLAPAASPSPPSSGARPEGREPPD